MNTVTPHERMALEAEERECAIDDMESIILGIMRAKYTDCSFLVALASASEDHWWRNESEWTSDDYDAFDAAVARLEARHERGELKWSLAA